MFKMIRTWFDRHLGEPQIVILGLVLLAGFLVVFYLGQILMPFLTALVIAYLLEGAVAGMAGIGIHRKVSFVIVFTLFMASVFVMIFGLTPVLSRQIGQFFQELPAMVSSGQQELMKLPERYPDLITEAQVQDVMSYITAEITTLAQKVFIMSLASVKGIITLIVYLILVPLLVFFFLKDKTQILTWLKQFLPQNRTLINEVWKEVNEQISNYVRGKIWEIIIVWWVSFITLRLFEMKFAMLISLFVGLSVLIPYLGATIMYMPVLLVGFFQWGLSSTFYYVILVYSIIQLLDGNLLVPLLLSEVVNIHPVAIIVSVLLFGGLWGIWGMFFAIPLATLVHAVIKAWQRALKETTSVTVEVADRMGI